MAMLEEDGTSLGCVDCLGDGGRISSRHEDLSSQGAAAFKAVRRVGLVRMKKVCGGKRLIPIPKIVCNFNRKLAGGGGGKAYIQKNL